VNEAFAAWNDIPGAAIELVDGGLTADLAAPCPPAGEIEGTHKVRFDDPDDEIADPVGCSGTLAVGGFCSTTMELKSIDGNQFHIATRGLVTFADNWQGCAQWTQCNIAEIATHETGHAIGLGHSSQNPNEVNARFRDATMYFRAHFDGRCAAVRDDDVAGASFIYPLAMPPTILSESPLPEAVFNQPYRFDLEAGGGAAPYSWALDLGCPEFGIALDSDGVVQGISSAVGPGCFDVVLADANGDTHEKRLLISLVETPTGPTRTPTATRTSAPPTPTPTITPTRAPVPCVGDCNGSGDVAVNELVTSVNIALGSKAIDACADIDLNDSAAVEINELIAAVNAALSRCVWRAAPAAPPFHVARSFLAPRWAAFTISQNNPLRRESSALELVDRRRDSA
jgi:hypothetical protein